MLTCVSFDEERRKLIYNGVTTIKQRETSFFVPAMSKERTITTQYFQLVCLQDQTFSNHSYMPHHKNKCLKCMQLHRINLGCCMTI